VADRKARRARGAHDTLAKPTRWRLQHGHFDDGVRGSDPETGTPVLHRRAVDTLGLMLANGTITQEMHDAGDVFRRAFRLAALDRMPRSTLIRLPGGAGETLSDRGLDARNRIAAAIGVLGGQDSAAGSCAWHVLGLEMSVREWALHRGWGGRPVSPPQAQGVLVATLGALAAHFRIAGRAR